MRALLILSIALSANLGFAKAKNCTDYDKFSDVSVKEMKTIVNKKSATIVDVNSDDSFKKSRIPGAIHYASNKNNFKKVLPKDKNALVVAYCGGKMCTAWQRAAKAACEMGYTNIRHFSEGITGWNKKAATKSSSKKS